VSAKKSILAVIITAMAAILPRIPLLWDDPWPSGYDGFYYVLQTRSWRTGTPLFADRSLVFWPLAGLSVLLGDVILANKVAACGFAAAGAVGMALGTQRFTGSAAAGLAAGTWWAVAPGHLIVSTEFLKNEAGLAVLGILWALLAYAETSRRAAVAAAVTAALGLAVHKLTGVFGAILAVGTGISVLWTHRRPPLGALLRQPKVLAGALGAAALLALSVGLLGVLRFEDFARFLAPQEGDGDRFALLWTSRRIHPVHRSALLVAHLLPVALALGLWRTGQVRGAAWVLLAVAVTAPLLPFGFDLTAWRLLLLAFVPAAFALGLLVAHTRPWTGIVATLLALSTVPFTVPHAARAEPDYSAWAEVVPVLQAHVPEGHRVVAHRGVCGFVWAVADRVCENFDPTGPPEGWWRIVYGMGEARLAPYSEVPPVRLMTGYTLVPEVAWRAFRADHVDTLPLVHHPRNPYRPRPGFVYGPQAETPKTP
jgi:hypothetical protein